MAAVGKDYLRDYWNWIDFTKIVISFIWPFLIYFHLDYELLNWIVVLLSVIRGLTGFRAFDSTRYYIKLIIESLKDVSFFLMIFVYTTLSYGLLSVAINDTEKSIGKILWIDSFGLGFGDGITGFNDFDLRYGTYILAIILNVVLMLNMIISIFGDSFDKFQLFSNYYNYKEMTEVILELEHIFSFLNRPNKFRYIHAIVNPYIKDDDTWKGKVLENKELLDKTNKEIRGVKDDIKSVRDDIKSEIKVVNDGFRSEIKVLNDGFSSVKNDIKAVENKITLVEEKLEAILNLLQTK